MFNKAKLLGSAIAAGLFSPMGIMGNGASLKSSPMHGIIPRTMGKRKGNFPQGKRCKARDAKKYIPAGEKKNVIGAMVTHAIVARDMNDRHDAWYEANEERFDAVRRGETRRAISLRENEERDSKPLQEKNPRGFAMV